MSDVAPQPNPDDQEQDVERLSAELKAQVERAKERISDRYGKLIEGRSFQPKPRKP
jgi:hypothetical protein